MEAFQPLLDLLGGNAKSSVATIVAWFLAIRFALVFVHDKIKRLISDRLNAVAASESTDDDEYLRRLFSTAKYKAVAFGGLMIGIPLPTLADLERAIRLQQEAAEKIPTAPRSSGSAGIVGLVILAVTLSAGPLVLTGCTTSGGAATPQAITYLTLRDVWAGVESGMKIYGTACATGRVSAEKQAEIDAGYIRLRTAWRLAVTVARNNQSAPAPEDVRKLADDLQVLITRL